MTETEEVQRYSFSSRDKITYYGMDVRYKESTKDGIYVYEVKNPAAYQRIDHDHIAELIQASKLRVQRDYYSLAKIKLRDQGKALPLSDLEDEEAADVRFKYDMVMTYRAMKRALPPDQVDRDQVAAAKAFTRVSCAKCTSR